MFKSRTGLPPLYTKAASLSLSGLSHPLLVPPRISHFPATFLLLWRQKPEAAAKMQTQSWLLKVGKEGERSEEKGKQVGVKRKKTKKSSQGRGVTSTCVYRSWQVIKIKLVNTEEGKHWGWWGTGTWDPPKRVTSKLQLCENKSQAVISTSFFFF